MTLPLNTRPLTPSLLLSAYGLGLFPMAEARKSPNILWLDPSHRGVLPLRRFSLSKRALRAIRNAQFVIRVDRNFAAVVAHCASRAETWINAEIEQAYCSLHRIGAAHSVEVYRQGESALLGGLYGVAMKGAFFGESMFSRVNEASKAALQFLVLRLCAQGYSLLDTQFLTPHLESMGGIEITRNRYQDLLAAALQLDCQFLLQPERQSAKG